MKEITMFMFDECPHCQLALRLMDELKEENPAYAELQVEMINERENPEIADQYDYWYVPTYYVDGKKIHEGHAEREDVEKVFRTAAS